MQKLESCTSGLHEIDRKQQNVSCYYNEVVNIDIFSGELPCGGVGSGWHSAARVGHDRETSGLHPPELAGA